MIYEQITRNKGNQITTHESAKAITGNQINLLGGSQKVEHGASPEEKKIHTSGTSVR
jgi:hypothetical protein